MLIHGLILFATATAGVFVGCALFGYQLEPKRKFGAPAALAVTAILAQFLPSIPFIDTILPMVVFYVVLMDDTLERDKVNKVSAFTLFFVVIASALIYRIPGS